jgi:intracellular septation protein A
MGHGQAGAVGPRTVAKGPFLVETSNDAGRTPAKGGRLRAIAMIVIFDVAAPLAAYSLLRSAGLTAVTALLLSGVFPALGVTIGAIQHRRLDVVGALVLAGIVVGTVLGLVSHSSRLLLVEGSVPTALFGVACLGSLCRRHPLMFSFALEFTGPDTAKGREMTRLWHYEGYRRVFRIITAVWGVGFLLEATLRVVIVYNTSTGTALASSKVMPFLWGAILSAWTVGYGARHKKKGERMAATTSEIPGTGQVHPPSPDVTQSTDLT